LFQQMVGRGLRLNEGKTECLVIDYANNGIDLYDPEVGEPKPAPDTEPVQVFCPECGHANLFWGRTDTEGDVIEHFGRRCQGLLESGEQCRFRYKFKRCGGCGSENDIAARSCHSCKADLIDPDELIKRALSLKDHKVIRCAGVSVKAEDGAVRLTYHDEDGQTLSEKFDLGQVNQRALFNALFGCRAEGGAKPLNFSSNEELLSYSTSIPHPDFVISRKQGKFWRIAERLFDYQGPYRRANEL
jgi:DNA repair protein RadD